MKEQWIVFYPKQTDKELAAISVEGTFQGEVEATKELLAYENNISVEDIETKVEFR